MAGNKFTDDELSGLTDEERAGLEDDDLLDDPEKEGAGDEEEEETEPAKPTEQEKPVEKADEEVEPAKPTEPAAPAPADVPAEQEAEPEPSAAPPLPYQAPENAKTRIDEIDKALDEAAAKFDDGEMTAREWREQERTLKAEQENLKKEILKAEFAEEQANQVWYGKVKEFLAQNPDYAKFPGRHRALDQEVRRLQADPDANPRDPALLRKAHAKVLKDLGLEDTGPKPKPKDPQRRRPDPPPTLANVPAADIEDTDDGAQFSYLDRLSGTAYEAALAKLTPEQQDAYLASQ